MKGLNKIGDYMPVVCDKDNGSFCGAKEGETFWTIKTSNDSYMDTMSQDNALIISLLLKLNKKIGSL